MSADILGILALLAVAAAPLPLAAALASADSGDSDGERDSPGERLLHAAAWWWGAHGLLLMLLGCLGLFSRPALLIGEAIVAALGVVLAWRRRTAVAAWRAGLDRSLRTRLAGDGTWPQRLLVAATLAFAAVATLALVAIPTQNYDSLMYQLPLLAEWVQDGSLHGHQQQWTAKATYEQGILWYPAQWNLMGLLAVLPTGHAQAVLLPNLAAWAVFALAVSGLARRLSPNGLAWPRHLLAAALASAPQTVANLFSAHVDLAFAAALLLGLHLALGAVQRRSAPLALAGVVALGLALGGKLSAPVWVAALVAAMAVGWWMTRRSALPGASADRWRFAAHPLALGLALAVLLLCGCGWYLRNWWATGNPLGVVQVEALGRVWFDGLIGRDFIARTSLLGNFPLRSSAHWWLLGGALAYFLGTAAGVLAVCLHGLPARLWRERPPLLLPLLALAAAWSWLYIAGPWSAKHAHDAAISAWMWQQLRYTFAIWGVLAAVAAATMPAPRPWLRWTLLVAVLAGMVAAWWRFPLRTPWMLAGLFAAATALSAWRLPVLLALRAPACPGRRWALGLTLAGAAAAVIAGVRPLHDALRDRLTPVPSFLRRGDPRPIAFHGSHQSWLLYGDDLRRPVRYLAIDGSRDLDRDLGRALDRALAADCAAVAVGPWPPFLDEPPAGPAVIAWLLAHPERARLVFGDPADPWRMSVFVLLPRSPGPSTPRPPAVPDIPAPAAADR